jgi:hypothetical protein
VTDPSNHLLYAAHQYFDSDGSGTYARSYDADGAYPTLGVDRLQPFLGWLAAHHARGILTEYGVPNTEPRWDTLLFNFLSTLNSNSAIQGGNLLGRGAMVGHVPAVRTAGPGASSTAGHLEPVPVAHVGHLRVRS